MARAPRHFFGIDFGTSSCSVSYVVDDPRLRGQRIVQTISVQFDRDGEASTRMPSIVAGDLDGSPDEPRSLASVGWRFFAQLLQRKSTPRLLRRGRDFFTSIKSDLGQFRVYPHSRIEGVTSPIDATRRVFEELIAATGRFRSELNIRESPVVITVPASASALARKDLIDAVVAAGLDRSKVELLDEPVAALVDLLNSPDAGATLSDRPTNILVFDFGAGTCDLALVQARFEEGKDSGIAAQILAISPYRRLGGDEVDRAIVGHIVAQALADPASLNDLSDADRRALEDTLMSAVAQPLKEKLCREVDTVLKAHFADGWERLQREPIIVQHSLERGFGDIRQGTRFTLASDAFQRLMAPFVEWPLPEGGSRSLMEPVCATLKKAGLPIQNLDLLVLHGGSAKIPHVRRLLQQRLVDDGSLFRMHVTTTPDMLTSVASGAAITCYWRHCRDQEFVVPVLGEDLGIVTSNGVHHDLVRARTTLPHPADPDALADPMDRSARFFTPDADVAHVLVPFFVGDEESRRMAGSVRIPIPLGTPRCAPIRIKLRVGRDKIVEWFTSMNGGAFVKQETLHDPWTRETSSGAARDLVEARRRMAEAIARDESVTPYMLVDEARCLLSAERYEEALAFVDDAIENTCRGDAWAWNIRGSALYSLGCMADAVDAFRKAADLAPATAGYWSNLGLGLSVSGRIAEAEAAFRHALSLKPQCASTHEELGRLARRRGDETAARIEFERALMLAEAEVETTPFSRDAWTLASRVRHCLGKYDESDAAGVVSKQIDTEVAIDGSASEWIRGRDEKWA